MDTIVERVIFGAVMAGCLGVLALVAGLVCGMLYGLGWMVLHEPVAVGTFALVAGAFVLLFYVLSFAPEAYHAIKRALPKAATDE